MSENRVSVTDVPRDRRSLDLWCAGTAAEYSDKMHDTAMELGVFVAVSPASHADIIQLTRDYWFYSWMLGRWNSMREIVCKATHEGDAYNAVCDFYGRSKDHLKEEAEGYISERIKHIMPAQATNGAPRLVGSSLDSIGMLAAGALGYWAGQQSGMFDQHEREKLIAKLTEGTVKIGAPPLANEQYGIAPGAIESIVFSVYEPMVLKRLAFGEDCKRLFMIKKLMNGNRIVLDQVPAEAFGDPGALIPDMTPVYPDSSTKHFLYPGMRLELQIENISGEAIHPMIWIACERIQHGCGVRGIPVRNPAF